MIAEGRVALDQVEYNDLPWKYAAGTPNILGAILSARALRLLVDLTDADPSTRWFGGTGPLPRASVTETMRRVSGHVADVTELALRELSAVDGLSIYGPPAGAPRSPLVAFNIDGVDPLQLARQLGREGIEARAGCHCATLAHRDLGLDPPASCRLSFAVYTSHDDVLRAVEGVRGVAQRLRRRHGSGLVNVG